MAGVRARRHARDVQKGESAEASACRGESGAILANNYAEMVQALPHVPHTASAAQPHKAESVLVKRENLFEVMICIARGVDVW